MALPTTPFDSWTQGMDLPSGLFEDTFGGTDYELYEDDGEYVLSLDMPGFSTDEIEAAWDDGMLNVAAEHVAEDRGQRKTYHRRFRFPKEVDEDAISAEYTNGVLEVRLPVTEEAPVTGKRIPIEG